MLTLVALAVPAAAADDIYDIDGRLERAGLSEAYVDTLDTDRGPRVTVDFDAGKTTSAEAFQERADQAAELIWKHLDVRVEAIDVQVTSGVPWLDGGLPGTASYTRLDLQKEYGVRPAALDEKTDAYAIGGLGIDALAVTVVVVVVVVLVVVVVVITLLLVRRSRRTREAAWAGGQAWGVGQAWGAMAPDTPVSGSPAATFSDPDNPWAPPAR